MERYEEVIKILHSTKQNQNEDHLKNYTTQTDLTFETKYVRIDLI